MVWVFPQGRERSVTERPLGFRAGSAEVARVAHELRAFIDMANAPIFGVDSRGRVNEWNRKVCIRAMALPACERVDSDPIGARAIP